MRPPSSYRHHALGPAIHPGRRARRTSPGHQFHEVLVVGPSPGSPARRKGRGAQFFVGEFRRGDPARDNHARARNRWPRGLRNARPRPPPRHRSFRNDLERRDDRSNFSTSRARFEAMLMAFRSLLPAEAPPPSQTRGRRLLANGRALEDTRASDDFGSDFSRLHLDRMCAVARPWKGWRGEEPHSVRGLWWHSNLFDARIDETARDWQPETERNEFEIVMTSACGAGDVFGCGFSLRGAPCSLCCASLKYLLHLV